MSKTLLLSIIILLLFSRNGFAQNFESASSIGYSKNPLSNSSSPEHVDGSPLFNKQYCSGMIQLVNGKTYDGLNLKLNLQENKIIVVLDDGIEAVITSPVHKVILHCNSTKPSAVFVSGLPSINNQNDKSLYQLLDSGEMSLLKYTEVRYKDTKDYNGNYITRRSYYQTPEYYVWSPGKDLLKISLNEDELLTALSPQRKLLLDILLKENIKLKKETDLIKLFTLYNSRKK